MKLELFTISVKKFLAIGIGGGLLGLYASWVAVDLTGSGFWALGVIPIFVLALFLAHRFSQSVMVIDLSDPAVLRLGAQDIAYADVAGYFVNTLAAYQTALSLKLRTGKSVHVTSSSVGERGRHFQNVMEQVIKKLQQNVPDLKVLGYGDVHERLAKVLLPIMVVTMVLILLLDVYLLYRFINYGEDLPLAFFTANLMMVSGFPMLKVLKRRG